MTVLGDLAKETGVDESAIRALFVTAPNAALVLRVREIEAKRTTVQAEAARVAGEYQATVEELTRMRNELQAEIDAEMGKAG